jgi:uncharacterized protein (TIGR03435 family)
MKLIRFVFPIFFIYCAALSASLFAQTPTKLSFEVASIKPLPPLMTLAEDLKSGKFDLQKLGTTIDGARVDIGATTLSELIIRAYNLKVYQVVGPDWMPSQLFEVHAKIPEGVSKEQIPEMLQSLLEERFKLTAHRENKEQPIYALIVSKDGHKLKEAIADTPTPAAAEDPAKTTGEKNSAAKGEFVIDSGEGKVKLKQNAGGMEISGGKIGQARINVTPTGVLYEFSKMGMTDFATVLSTYLDRPVLDMTDLKGSYQVVFEMSMAEVLSMAQKTLPKLGISLPPGLGASGDLVGSAPGTSGLGASDPAGGGIFQAIQKLGLKLDPRKAPFETLIIDRIEKTPTED